MGYPNLKYFLRDTSFWPQIKVKKFYPPKQKRVNQVEKSAAA